MFSSKKGQLPLRSSGTSNTRNCKRDDRELAKGTSSLSMDKSTAPRSNRDGRKGEGPFSSSRTPNTRKDRCDGRDLVEGMSSLSLSKSSAPPASRDGHNTHDTHRYDDDRHTNSSSRGFDHQASPRGPRAGVDRSTRSHHSTNNDQSYRTSANPSYKEVPRGSTATASGGGSGRVSRSQTKDSKKKVSSDRVEKSSTRKGRAAKVKRPKSKSPTPPKGAIAGNLSVEVYAPRAPEGNVPHWSLFVEKTTDGRGIIRDVVGEPNGFVFRAADNVRPENSGQHTKSIPVGDVHDIDYFDRTVRATKIDNDFPGWSCQDWVMAALDDLNVNGILEDDEYEAAKDRLGRRYNRGASSSSSGG